MEKYIITEDTLVISGITLHRIKRLNDGLIGGYVEAEKNPSQSGTCFLYDDGRAFGEAAIIDDAQVFGSVRDEALVSGNATVSGDVFGNASIAEHAELQGKAYDRAVIRGNAKVVGEAFGDSITEGSARVFGRIFGNAHVAGNEVVYGDKGS